MEAVHSPLLNVGKQMFDCLLMALGEEGAASTCSVSGLLARVPEVLGCFRGSKQKWVYYYYYCCCCYYFPVAVMLDYNLLSEQSNYNAVTSLKLKMYL